MIWLLVLAVLLLLTFEVAFGAPFVPLLKPEIGPVLDGLKLRRGETLVDLGCGDGRVLKVAAKRGIKGIGYEISPLIYLAAKVNCFKYRRLVKIQLANFWRVNLPEADAVFVFAIGRYMEKLDRFLAGQIKQPTKVLSYIYDIPGKVPAKTGRNYFIYHYPSDT